MSQQNVDLILGLPTFRAGVDFVPLTHDPDRAAKLEDEVAPLVAEDFECVFPNLLGGTKTYVGIDGMRAAWVDWLTPWTSYRVELERALDCGDRVVTFYDVFAAPRGTTHEVKLSGADVWTLRDGKITRWEGFPNRNAALRAVGLEHPEETATRDVTELVRQSTEPVNRRDYDAMMRFWHPDGTWDLSPLGLGVYEGHAAVRRFFEDWIGAYDEVQIEFEEIRDLGNGVAFAVLVQSGRPAGSASSVRLRYASFAIWRDGLIERSTQYSDIDEARAAAELLAAERG